MIDHMHNIFCSHGDRLVAVTAEGDIVWPDKLLMLFAKDIVSRNPGSDVIYDVKCTRHLNSVISGFGGRPIISRSGHSFIKEKLAETGALLGITLRNMASATVTADGAVITVSYVSQTKFGTCEFYPVTAFHYHFSPVISLNYFNIFS